jgi:hypothetical protein
MEVAAMGLGARDLATDVATGTQYAVMAFKRVGAEAWVSRCGITGRWSVGEDQRYVQKEFLPPEAV